MLQNPSQGMSVSRYCKIEKKVSSEAARLQKMGDLSRADSHEEQTNPLTHALNVKIAISLLYRSMPWSFLSPPTAPPSSMRSHKN